MRAGNVATLVLFLLTAVIAPTPSPASADDRDGGRGAVRSESRLGPSRKTPAGTFAGVAYVRHDGIFEGRTSTGAFRVPYRITAPADPRRGNRTLLIEPSHFAIGLGALERYLRPNFLFSRGFVHAGIGWSTASFGEGADLRILDPKASGVFIRGGVQDENGRTDDEIIIEFARALTGHGNAERGGHGDAEPMVDRLDRQYLTGFSDSSDPVLRLVTSGRAGDVFDFVLPFTASGHTPQAALADGRFRGKLIVVNSEAEGASLSFIDRNRIPDRYRYYAVAGTPHIPDFLDLPFFTTNSTPASFEATVRAHFQQGHAWVRSGQRPPPSTHLRVVAGETLARDTNGNAIAVNASGHPVPRLPYIELGEAHFIADFVGSYDSVKTIAALGFSSHREYVRAFEDRLADYVRADYMLREDAEVMQRRAALCAPLTFTQTYRDRYDAFVAAVRC